MIKEKFEFVNCSHGFNILKIPSYYWVCSACGYEMKVKKPEVSWYEKLKFKFHRCKNDKSI